MSTGYILTEGDAATIRRAVDIINHMPVNTRNRPAAESHDSQTSDLYVAHVEAGGIPAMAESGGTGTGSPALHGDVPGSGRCDVYRRLPGRMIPVGLSLTVYNYSPAAIPGSQWIPVARDKFGDWVALSQSGSSGGGSGSGGSFSGAECFQGSAQTVTAASGNANLLFDNENYDTDSYHDLTTHTDRLTVPVDGYYLIGGNVVWGIAGVAATVLGTVSVVVNNSAANVPGYTIQSTALDPSVANLWEVGVVPIVIYMQAGWYVTLYVTHTAPIDLTITSNSFWIAKLDGGSGGGSGVTLPINLASQVTGVLPSANGGTGSAVGPMDVGVTVVNHSPADLPAALFITGGNLLAAASATADGQVLKYNGSSLVFAMSPYSPANAGDWLSTPPSLLAEGIDRIAAWISTNFPLLTKP